MFAFAMSLELVSVLENLSYHWENIILISLRKRIDKCKSTSLDVTITIVSVFVLVKIKLSNTTWMEDRNRWSHFVWILFFCRSLLQCRYRYSCYRHVYVFDVILIFILKMFLTRWSLIIVILIWVFDLLLLFVFTLSFSEISFYVSINHVPSASVYAFVNIYIYILVDPKIESVSVVVLLSIIKFWCKILPEYLSVIQISFEISFTITLNLRISTDMSVSANKSMSMKRNTRSNFIERKIICIHLSYLFICESINLDVRKFDDQYFHDIDICTRITIWCQISYEHIETILGSLYVLFLNVLTANSVLEINKFSINRSINRSIFQWVKWPMDQSMNQGIDRSMKRRFNQSFNLYIYRSINHRLQRKIKSFLSWQKMKVWTCMTLISPVDAKLKELYISMK